MPGKARGVTTSMAHLRVIYMGSRLPPLGKYVWSRLPPLGKYVLWVFRYYLGGRPMRIFNPWWKRQPNHVAVDSCQILQGVSLTCGIPYGDGEDEALDEIVPTTLASGPVVLYAHGGGFVAVSSMLLNGTITPIARAGCRVYSIDYPLAPEHPWPAAVLSTLRALAWIRRRTGAGSVALVGDSAGGNLVAFAAALLASRSTLAALADHTGEPLLSWELPAISSVCSVYGFLDGESWRGATVFSFAIEWCWRATFGPERGAEAEAAELTKAAGTAEAAEASELTKTSKVAEASTPRRRTLRRTRSATWRERRPVPRHLLECDASRLENYPRTLLLAASDDALLGCSRRAAAFLRAAGAQVELREYRAAHGFLGMPPQWTLGSWKRTSAPAMEAIVHFLIGRPVRYPRAPLPLDKSIVVVVTGLGLAHAALVGLAARALLAVLS